MSHSQGENYKAVLVNCMLVVMAAEWRTDVDPYLSVNALVYDWQLGWISRSADLLDSVGRGKWAPILEYNYYEFCDLIGQNSASNLPRSSQVY